MGCIARMGCVANGVVIIIKIVDVGVIARLWRIVLGVGTIDKIVDVGVVSFVVDSVEASSSHLIGFALHKIFRLACSVQASHS